MTDTVYLHIYTATHVLVPDSYRVVSGLSKVIGYIRMHILVRLEFHQAAPDSGTTRSRTCSAA